MIWVRWSRVATIMVGLLALYGLVAFAPASAAVPSIALSKLDGASTPRSFRLVVDVPGGTSSKLVVDGVYVGQDQTLPLGFDLNLAPGSHRAKVRTMVGSVETRADVTFTVGDPVASTTTTARPATTTTPTTVRPSTTTSPSTVPSNSPSATTTIAPAAPSSSRTIAVDTVDEIRAAVAGAAPGSVILVADGEYTFRPRLEASASGTAAAPITIRGSRNAVLRTTGVSGDYGLHVTGDHWRVEGLTVAHAGKGIVLDGSVGTVIDGVEVHDIGAEGVHFRTCSSDGVLRNSFVHDTGRSTPNFGEGAYVGSTSSNWPDFQCTDAVERSAVGDNTERVLIEDNLFEDVPAEGADLKEGTNSGVVRRNTFRRVGGSGLNSADSAVDVKGNNWVVEDNLVSGAMAPWDDHGVATPSRFADGFQSHTVDAGYGTGNVFRRNRVDGPVPGFGVGLYPGSGNIAACDNVAPGAAKGLVGDNGKATACRS